MKLNDIVDKYKLALDLCQKNSFFIENPMNSFWGSDNLLAMREIINQSKTLEEIVHNAQKTFMFSLNTTDDTKNDAVDWLIEEQLSRNIDIFALPKKIQESKFSLQANCVVKNGKSLSPDFIRTVNISLNIAKYLNINPAVSILSLLSPQKKINILELGAGLGHLARTLRIFGLSNRHIILDLPETLVFSMSFLSLNFPDAKMYYVSDVNEKINIKDYDFIFIPTVNSDFLNNKEFDLFLNTASLGEMDNKDIRKWMDFIQNKIYIKYLYTLNRYLNTVDPAFYSWRYLENEASLHYDRNWKILSWALEPTFCRSPYIDPLIARYVEIIAERSLNTSIEECIKKSNQLINKVIRQDWVRYESKFKSINTARHNILVNDTTVSGTIFMLWEAVRLNQTSETLSLLIKYLDTLIKYENIEFEEMIYYEKSLLELLKSHDENTSFFSMSQIESRLFSRDDKTQQHNL